MEAESYSRPAALMLASPSECDRRPMSSARERSSSIPSVSGFPNETAALRRGAEMHSAGCSAAVLSRARLDKESTRDGEGHAIGRQHGRSGVPLAAVGL